MNAPDNVINELAGVIPEDSEIEKFDLEGRPTVELGAGCVAVKSAFSIFNELIEK